MTVISKAKLEFQLPDLPFAYDALGSIMSSDTLHLHHDKHHAAYVRKTNELSNSAGLDGLSLEAVMQRAKADNLKALYNNAAQAWNHAFFWRSMTATSSPPSGAVRGAIDSAFGSFDGLRTAFVDAGSSHFGSGWVWLAFDTQLRVISTHDAENLLGDTNFTPLMVCDVWEHAYYLDYKNDRPAFLGAWFDRLANWAFAEQQMLSSNGVTPAYAYPAAA